MKKTLLKYLVMGLIVIAATVSMACSWVFFAQPKTPKALEN